MNSVDEINVMVAGLNELDLVTTLFDKYRVFYNQESNLEAGRKFIEERMKEKQSVIFLVTQEQVNDVLPLGFVQLFPSFSSVSMERLWILNDLYVDQSARRLGVAKLLLEKAKEYAIQTNSKGLVLETAIDNLNAQRLYESIGYKKDRGTMHYSFYLK
ncbi:GNAT family N-acetyltransferase [Bacillus sp. FJAT-22090]|uniref:GNAT family N-acetyltransferase n=1 Tax=Bacillus sp. FJAT-22090 TaxID=1581038 RepID=UPI0006AFDBF1|nr:GNAT family N-acetyltransferase [Bacillus sp. FJAT-22090]